MQLLNEFLRHQDVRLGRMPVLTSNPVKLPSGWLARRNQLEQAVAPVVRGVIAFCSEDRRRLHWCDQSTNVLSTPAQPCLVVVRNYEPDVPADDLGAVWNVGGVFGLCSLAVRVWPGHQSQIGTGQVELLLQPPRLAGLKFMLVTVDHEGAVTCMSFRLRTAGGTVGHTAMPDATDWLQLSERQFQDAFPNVSSAIACLCDSLPALAEYLTVLSHYVI